MHKAWKNVPEDLRRKVACDYNWFISPYGNLRAQRDDGVYMCPWGALLQEVDATDNPLPYSGERVISQLHAKGVSFANNLDEADILEYMDKRADSGSATLAKFYDDIGVDCDTV